MEMENARALPLKKTKTRRKYTLGEEILNAVTHGIGALFGVFVIVFGVVRSVINARPAGIAGSIVFGVCMLITYGVSTVYHSLRPSAGKRVLQVIDHCAVYLLIMGTYTGIMLAGVLTYSLAATIAILSVEAVVGVVAITLTAINMKKFSVVSMIGYIVLGWCLIVIPHIMIGAIGLAGFLWLLCGGIAYTVGSILYGAGKKHRYMHGVFHIFCLIGSALQFVAFAVYCL